MKRSRRVLLAVTAGVILLGTTGTCAVADAVSDPVNAQVGPPPGDLGAETVAIPGGSGQRLAGWLVRGAKGRGAVLLLHGVRTDRRSMLGRARFLRDAGYTVLLVDLQAHGENPGDRITFGARESLDARAALTYLRSAAPREAVGAIGVSLGGASLLLGDGEPAANLASAIVLEAVYPTIEEAVANRLRIRLGPPGSLLTPLLMMWLRPLVGVKSGELRPIDRIGAVRIPVLLIAGRRDRHTTAEESERLFDAAPMRKELWLMDGAMHQDLHAFARAEYERGVLEFFQRHLRGRGGQG